MHASAVKYRAVETMVTNKTIKDSPWRAATPLSHAPIHFAPTDLQNTWRGLSERSAMNEANSHYQSNSPSSGSWIEHFAAMIEGAKPLVMAREDVLKQAKAHLLRALLRGEYTAFGFEAPRTLASVPLEIPAEHWHGRIDWSASELHSQSLRFVEVRLLPTCGQYQLALTVGTPPQADSLRPPQDQLPPPTPAKAGRPSIKVPVTDAFQALAAQGHINPKASAKSHYPLVREWIATNCTGAGVDANKLSDEGIRAHFSPLFGSFKEDRKQ